MPTSATVTISPVMSILQRQKPQRILDIGCGDGRWGVLCRTALDGAIQHRRFWDPATWQLRIFGIEIDERYKTPVHQYCYDRVLWMDVHEGLDKIAGCCDQEKFDAVIMGDVIEHFAKDEALLLVDRIRRRHINPEGIIVITTPVGFMEQGEFDGNPHETHRSGWDFRDWADLGDEFIFKHEPRVHGGIWMVVLQDATVYKRMSSVLRRKKYGK